MRVTLPPHTAIYSMEAWKNRGPRPPDGTVVRFEMRVDGPTHTIDHGTQGELELAQMEARQLMESLMHFFNIEVRE